MIEANLPILPIVVLLLGALLVPAFGMRRRAAAHPISLGMLTLFLIVAFALFQKVMADGVQHYRLGGWQPPVGIEFVVDLLSAFMLLVIAAIAFLVCIYARVAVRAEMPTKEVPFYGVMFIMLLGLSGMVLTGDLFNLYVFFEVSSLGGYALMAVGHRKAPVSAFRYLILGTLGASFYLLGVGYLYVLTGSLNMADVASLMPNLVGNPALLLSITLMLGGLGLKMALFPMHLWLPDAYTYASSTATAIIAPVMTKVSAYVLLRILFFVYDQNLVHDVLPIDGVILWLGLAGVTVGSIMAIAQKDAKRMLAYSSVAQVAYIAVGIGLANRWALVAAMLHVVNHAAMKCCLFLITGGVFEQTGSTRISSYTSLGRAMPWTFAAFAVAALSMVGIPPTNGFFSKWYLVLGAIDAGQWTVVAIIIASGLLTGVYFFRMIARIFTIPEEGAPVESEAHELPLSQVAPIVVLAVGLLTLGLFNSWIVNNVLLRALPPLLRLGG
jgi:multicomponent Na+:H+ antiporter subunit D